MRAFDLLTVHGTQIVVDTATGVLCHVPAADGRWERVLAYAPDETVGYVALVAADGRAVRMAGDELATDAIGLHATRLASGHHTLRQPITDLLLAAEPPADGVGALVANRPAVGPWEGFRLRPVAGYSHTAAAVLAGLADTMRRAAAAPDLLAVLRSGTGDAAFGFAAALRALPIADLAWLGGEIGRDPVAADGLAARLRGDPWAVRALPDLARFLRGTRTAPAFQRAIDTGLDELAVAGLNGEYVSVGQMLNSFARRAVRPTRSLCAVTAVRNEGLYLVEWLAYHRQLGVNAFFIYSNDNDDGSDALLAALSRAGVVNWIRNTTAPGVSPQYKAYGHAFQFLPELLDYRWAAVIDLDEFLAYDTAQYASLAALLAARDAEGADAVALNWLIFGSGGQVRRDPRPVSQRFQQREPGVNLHVKSLCRPNLFHHAHPHYPIWDRWARWNFRHASGAAHPQSRLGDASAFAPRPADTGAWINHYLTKSAEEYLLRRASSRGDMPLATLPSGAFFDGSHADFFIDRHANPGMATDARIQSCAPGLEAEIAAIRALPGVADALAAIEASYRQRLQALLPVLAADPRFGVAGSAERWFLDLLAT